MRFGRLAALLIIGMLVSCRWVVAQDSITLVNKIIHFPNKLFVKVNRKATEINNKLEKQTEKYLNRLTKQEANLRKKLQKVDPSTAKELFPDKIEQQYTLWLHKMKSDTFAKDRPPIGEYYPYIDSIHTSLSFLDRNPQLIDQTKQTSTELQAAKAKLQRLQNKMQDAGQIKQYIQQRKEQMRLGLSRYAQIPPGLLQAYNNYNRQYFYYAQQVKEYKDMVNDPEKMIRSVLKLLNKVPAFTNFYKSHSMLASTFDLPGIYTPDQTTGKGLPTRDQVLNAFQNQIGKTGPDLTPVVQKNLVSGQGSADELSGKLSTTGTNIGSDIDLPDFSPNSQKTKSILKRLVYGIDLQTVPGSYFFPATSDMGFSLGYKLDDNNIVGIGISYKLGWGKDIGHIKMSSQGTGIRTYADIRIKKSLFASGGLEYNYQRSFDPGYIPGLINWQRSGLVGLSKIFPLKRGVFKSTKIQILWDFLSYQQIPRTQPFKFRVGYSF